MFWGYTPAKSCLTAEFSNSRVLCIFSNTIQIRLSQLMRDFKDLKFGRSRVQIVCWGSEIAEEFELMVVEKKLMVVIMLMRCIVIVEFAFVISHWYHSFCININSCELWQSHNICEYDATNLNGPLPINGALYFWEWHNYTQMLKRCLQCIYIYIYTNIRTQSDGQMS